MEGEHRGEDNRYIHETAAGKISKERRGGRGCQQFTLRVKIKLEPSRRREKKRRGYDMGNVYPCLLNEFSYPGIEKTGIKGKKGFDYIGHINMGGRM